MRTVVVARVIAWLITIKEHVKCNNITHRAAHRKLEDGPRVHGNPGRKRSHVRAGERGEYGAWLSIEVRAMRGYNYE